MSATTLLNPIASRASQRAVAAPSAELAAQLDDLAELAKAEGLHVEGLPLAAALIDRKELQRLKKLVFNSASLVELRAKANRIEFITEGPLPPDLLLEPAAKLLPVFNQVVDYALCKGCRLCIQVCPKRVYQDDGFGKPDPVRRDEECTGNAQCGQCVYICPERAIALQMASPIYESTVFVQLENPYTKAEAMREPQLDFAVPNPLDIGATLRIDAALPANDLGAANRLLDVAGFHPVLELMGIRKHFVDASEPEGDLTRWAAENARSAEATTDAVETLYAGLPLLANLKQGNYALDNIIHRVIDEMLYAAMDAQASGGKQLLQDIVDESFLSESYLGSKRRPIGGLLPPGTSTAWKTPYGNEIPEYNHLEKCLGPECGLCVTHCPEGNGGETSAIKMIPLAPLGTIPALVRGLQVHLLKLDGSQTKLEDMEDLSGRQAFTFEVNADYCKSCGICIACCPHDVIDPTTRTFNMGETL